MSKVVTPKHKQILGLIIFQLFVEVVKPILNLGLHSVLADSSVTLPVPLLVNKTRWIVVVICHVGQDLLLDSVGSIEGKLWLPNKLQIPSILEALLLLPIHSGEDHGLKTHLCKQVRNGV